MVINDKKRCQYNNNIVLNGTKLSRIGKKEPEEGFKFVGIILDEDLNWSLHIKYIISKVKKNLYVLSVNKKLLPLRVRMLLYNALVKPTLDYGLLIWGGKQNKALNILQKKAVRTISLSSHNAHTNKLFIRNNILKLDELTKISMLRLMHSVAYGYAPVNILTSFSLNTNYTRSGSMLNFMLPSNLKIEKTNIFYLGPVIWNELEMELKLLDEFRQLRSILKYEYINNYRSIPDCKVKNCYVCLLTKEVTNL